MIKRMSHHHRECTTTVYRATLAALGTARFSLLMSVAINIYLFRLAVEFVMHASGLNMADRINPVEARSS
jgi:hypothetical protein